MEKLITKGYKLGITKKFDDGSIVSIEFFSRLDEDSSILGPEELFEAVYNSTMEDIKKTVSIDPVVKSLWNNVKNCIKKEMKVEKLLEDMKKKNGDTVDKE